MITRTQLASTYVRYLMARGDFDGVAAYAELDTAAQDALLKTFAGQELTRVERVRDQASEAATDLQDYLSR